jgi:hypothetical protein
MDSRCRPAARRSSWHWNIVNRYMRYGGFVEAAYTAPLCLTHCAQLLFN